MADYGQDLRFGVFLTPRADRAQQVLELATVADAVGLDYVTIQDHPYQPAFLDSWTLLSAIAARTQSIRLAQNVANLPLRTPMSLARTTASLAVVSGGRVDLGLGAGAFWDGIEAEGGPRRTPGQSVSALQEAIEIIRACWSGDGPIRFQGDFYEVKGARPGPPPGHRIELWLGAYKPRMLRLTGAQADGWVPSMGYADPSDLVALSETLDEAAAATGRAPADVRRIYNINGRFNGGGGFLAGRPADWAQQLAELTLTTGMSTYLLSASSADEVRIFATEVAPATTELVASARAADAPRAPVATGAAFGVVSADQGTEFRPRPTDPPTERFSSDRLLDESRRPSGPAPEPGRRYTAAEQSQGQHLIDVHDALRTELVQLREVIAQLELGGVDPQAARDHLARMTIRQNSWTVGTFCLQYCRALTGHHTLEDVSVFPHLRARAPELGPVLDCLFAEHEVIAASVDRIDEALVRFVDNPAALADVRQAVDAMTDALLSHLSYEEHELIEPLARVGFH